MKLFLLSEFPEADARVAAARSLLLGVTPAHRTLATALGASYVRV